VLVALLPVYRARNARWTELADVSSAVLADLRAGAATWPTGTRVVIEDDRTTRANLTNAWGGLVPEMARVVFDGPQRPARPW
jgi:hypothetical protein